MPHELSVDSIFHKYKNKVYHLALSISKNEKDAEDIMQNAFIKIIKNLDNFRNDSQVSTWIYRITYNEALMFLRKKYRQFKLTDNLAHFDKESSRGLFINWPKLPSEQLLSKEFQERTEGIIRNMPIKYRMPLLLHQVENLPVRDAALVLGLKENSLKTRLHRSYMILRDEIIDYFKDKIEEGKNEDSRCSIWTGLVYDYISGSLNKERKAVFNKHIEDCSNCRSFLDTYSQAIQITNALQCQDLPDELKAKIETFLFPMHQNIGNRR